MKGLTSVLRLPGSPSSLYKLCVCTSVASPVKWRKRIVLTSQDWHKSLELCLTHGHHSNAGGCMNENGSEVTSSGGVFSDVELKKNIGQ